MLNKILFTAAVLVSGAFLMASQTQAAGLDVSWTNSQNQSANYADYKGTKAEVTINLTNNDNSPKNVKIEKQTFVCDFGENPGPCGQNPVVRFETVTLSPGQTLSRTATQSVKTVNHSQCGSAQADFFVTDLSSGQKTGPYWDLAYTGKDCPSVFPACPPEALVRQYVSEGKDLYQLTVDGRKPDVAYADSFHWIVGYRELKRGTDLVYFISAGRNLDERKRKALQCFYPKRANKDNIQTNFIIKGGLTLPGWILVNPNDAVSLNLLNAYYWAKNNNF